MATDAMQIVDSPLPLVRGRVVLTVEIVPAGTVFRKPWVRLSDAREPVTAEERARVAAAWAAAGAWIAQAQEVAHVADHPQIAAALRVTQRARELAAELAECRRKAT
jgi:hypothetical protein